VICAELRAAEADEDEAAGERSWAIIVVGIRRHAAAQPAKIAADLHEWADLLEGVAELQARRRG
jgi:hypothetical protein